jgi:aconitate hydratase
MNDLKIDTVGLTGDEEIEIPNLDKVVPQAVIDVIIKKGGQARTIKALVRIDTPNELKYFQSGGILPFVLNRIASR